MCNVFNFTIQYLAYIEDSAEIQGKTTTVYVGVENLGTNKATAYSITVDGQKIEGTMNILSGERALLEATYKVPSTVSNRKVAITVDTNDALMTLQIAVGMIAEPTAEQRLAADVNGDGVVDAKEALGSLKFAVGIIKDFADLRQRHITS